MIANAPLIADLVLALAAVVGLLTLHGVLSGRDAWGPLNRRFLFGIKVLLALYLCRALGIITGIGLFYSLMGLAAGLIPVAVLILTEGLLRRHAPRWAKLFVLVGAVALTVLTLVPLVPDAWRTYATLAFQAAGLLIAGAMVVMRDRQSLSGGENRAVERLGLSLILLVPFAVIDAMTVALKIPVQASPIAVLFLCWLAIGLGGHDARHRGSLYGFGAVVLAAVVATWFVAKATGLDVNAGIMAGAVILSATLCSAVINEARHLRAEGQSLSMLRHIAQAPDDVMRFLRGFQDHPMVEGALVIEQGDLLDLDSAVLADIFTAAPVIRRTDRRTQGVERDYADHLFHRFDASHIFWVSGAPLRLVALSMPSVTASSMTELELAAVQRMASMMAAKGA